MNKNPKYKDQLPHLSRNHGLLLPILVLSVTLILGIELLIKNYFWPELPVFVFWGVLWLVAYATLTTIALWRLGQREGMTEIMLRSVLEKSKAGRLILDHDGEPVCLNSEAVRLTNGKPTAAGIAALFEHSPASAAAFAWLQQQAKTADGASIDLGGG